MDYKENSQTQKVGPEFPFCVFHKRWSECQGFSSNSIFELLCLLVGSPLSLHFFCRYQHIFHKPADCSHQPVAFISRAHQAPFVPSELLIFLKNAFTSSPSSQLKVFLKDIFQCIGHHNYFVVSLDFLKHSEKSLASLSLKELEKEEGEKCMKGFCFPAFCK